MTTKFLIFILAIIACLGHSFAQTDKFHWTSVAEIKPIEFEVLEGFFSFENREVGLIGYEAGNIFYQEYGANGSPTERIELHLKRNYKRLIAKQQPDNTLLLVGQFEDSLEVFQYAYVGNEVNSFFRAKVDSISQIQSVLKVRDKIFLSGSVLNSDLLHNAYLELFDLEGNSKWKKIFGAPSSDDVLNEMTFDNGELLITGSTTPFTPEQSYAWFLKISEEGKNIWEKYFSKDDLSYVGNQIFSLSNAQPPFVMATKMLDGAESLSVIETNKKGRLTKAHEGPKGNILVTKSEDGKIYSIIKEGAAIRVYHFESDKQVQNPEVKEEKVKEKVEKEEKPQLDVPNFKVVSHLNIAEELKVKLKGTQYVLENDSISQGHPIQIEVENFQGYHVYIYSVDSKNKTNSHFPRKGNKAKIDIQTQIVPGEFTAMTFDNEGLERIVFLVCKEEIEAPSVLVNNMLDLKFLSDKDSESSDSIKETIYYPDRLGFKSKNLDTNQIIPIVLNVNVRAKNN